MKYLFLISICISVSYGLQRSPHGKKTFCQTDLCITCVGRYCATTCQGKDCKNCPLGDCCDSNNCNICRGDNCCTTSECNNCVQACLQNCQEIATCHYDCFQRCSPTPNRGNSSRYSVINHYNYMPVNVTTIINITNTINNTHSLYNPVIVNNTYINNHTVHEKVYLNPKLIHRTLNPKFNCCYIVHPEKCQTVEKQDEILCFTAKHQECSNLCVSNYVHIIKSITPQQRCFNILVAPYNICGQYIAQNCDSCYNCTSNNKTLCTEEPNCREECKLGIIPENFYNKLYRKDI